MGTETNDQDKKLFQKAVASIDTIHPKYGIAMPEDTPAKTIEASHHHAMQKPSWLVSDMVSDMYKVGANDTLFYCKAGVQQQRLKRLKQGRLPIEASLDLHGHTIASCLTELNHFIAQCQQHGKRLVLMIHGKGGNDYATLKSLLNQTLRQHPAILAFCTAKLQHGGSGAMYVLLKSTNPGNHAP